jgi:uncharacterized protein (TIGR02231 family)
MRPLFAGLVLALAVPAFAEDAVRGIDSKIARVTIYEDRALVTRAAKTVLAKGASRVAFDHLPPGLDPASIRARCGAARVLGVDVETVHLVREVREELAKAIAVHDAAKRKLRGAEMELAEAKDRWELLRSIRAKGAEGAERALGGGAASDPALFKKILELVGDEGAAARKAVLAAQDAVDAAKAEEDAARRRVDELRAGDDRTESRVLVDLDAAADAGDAELTVQYMIGGASWTPVYDLRVDDDFGDASLGMSGVVVQRTGEDWKDVAVELTTAQPAAGAAPPEPIAWRIFLPRADGGVVATAAPAAPKPAAMRKRESAKDAADDGPMEMKEEGYAPVVRRTGLVVAFQSQLAETIPSDGRPSRVALARFDLKPDVRWTAFPRATDKVFVTAKMKNVATTALPAGEARVFVGADFVGPLALKDWGVGKEIDVGLGVDRDVEVEREKLKDERATEGVFSKDDVTTRAFRITVRNHRDRAIDVRLLDQVPVSNDEDLVVKVLEQSLPFAKLPDRDAETNKARGVLEWRCGLPPTPSQDVRFAFEVRHPKSMTAWGLD